MAFDEASGSSGDDQSAAQPKESGHRRRSRLGLPRNVVILSWVSFFADAASEMLYPVFPTFVTQTLGASPAVLGLIEGIADGTAAIGKAISGWLADRFPRRPLIVFGYAISAIANPVIGLAHAWPLALVGRFMDRGGEGTRESPRDALLSADATPQTRGRVFGFHRGAASGACHRHRR